MGQAGNGLLNERWKKSSLAGHHGGGCTLLTVHRPPSLPTRLARALVALITVWCLGCSGYEPLLDSLLGNADGGMSCAEMVQSADHGASATSSAVGAATAQHDSFDCGCGQSCHASSPLSGTPRSVLDVVPAVASLEVSTPPSVTRAPLLPPPETGTL